MNTVTPSIESTQIAEFAQEVRAALADLPADEVEDLTDGLEADLTESLAEDLRRTLPEPVAYAAELRQAAGLPAADRARRGVLAGMTRTCTQAREHVAEAVRRHPALHSVVDFLQVLRPLWWLVRAWLATWLLAAFGGMTTGLWFDGAFWAVMVALAVVSVQWGRRRWTFPGLQGVVVAGNVISVVLLLPVLDAALDGGARGDYDAGYADGAGSVGPSGTGQGLSLDGQPVENVYAYDAAGNRLTGVQLFDVDGRPLVPYRDVDMTQLLQTPAMLETGAKVYNVYPLPVTRMTRDENGELVPDPSPDPDKAAAYANGPFLKVPAVQSPAAAPEVVATPNK